MHPQAALAAPACYSACYHGGSSMFRATLQHPPSEPDAFLVPARCSRAWQSSVDTSGELAQARWSWAHKYSSTLPFPESSSWFLYPLKFWAAPSGASCSPNWPCTTDLCAWSLPRARVRVWHAQSKLFASQRYVLSRWQRASHTFL